MQAGRGGGTLILWDLVAGMRELRSLLLCHQRCAAALSAFDPSPSLRSVAAKARISGGFVAALRPANTARRVGHYVGVGGGGGGDGSGTPAVCYLGRGMSWYNSAHGWRRRDCPGAAARGRSGNVATTAFRGVSASERHAGKWDATLPTPLMVGPDGRVSESKHLGTFDTPEAAARAYDAMVVRIHSLPGAKLNFPDGPQGRRSRASRCRETGGGGCAATRPAGSCNWTSAATSNLDGLCGATCSCRREKASSVAIFGLVCATRRAPTAACSLRMAPEACTAPESPSAT